MAKKNAVYVEPAGYFKDEWLKEAGLGKYSEEYQKDMAKEQEERNAKKAANKKIRDFVNGK